MLHGEQRLVLRLAMDDIQPSIWRRISVDSAMSLTTLHGVMQICFGWYGYHLYQFTYRGEYYAPPDDEFGIEETKSPEVAVGTLLSNPGDRMVYEYDFGDGWMVSLVLEERIAAERREPRALCLAGERAGPLEDSGGPYGYMEKLEIIADPRHAEYAEIKEWMPVDFDPESFDLPLVNEELAKL